MVFVRTGRTQPAPRAPVFFFRHRHPPQMNMSTRTAAALFGLALLIACLPDLARDPSPDLATRPLGAQQAGK